MAGLPQCLSSEGPGSPSSQGGVGKGGVGDKAVTGVHGPSFILHTHSGAGAPALHLGQRAVQRRCCSGQKLALEAELFISRKSELTQGCAQRKEGRDAVGCAPHSSRSPREVPADPPRDLGAAAAHGDAQNRCPF